jgi:hypothetical protein
MNDCGFPGRVFVLCEVCPIGRLVGDGAKDFTLEGNSLGDEVVGGQNIPYVGENGRESLGGGTREG